MYETSGPWHYRLLETWRSRGTIFEEKRSHPMVPSSHERRVEPLPQTPEGQIFLAGLVWSQENAVENIANTLIASIMSGKYDGSRYYQ